MRPIYNKKNPPHIHPLVRVADRSTKITLYKFSQVSRVYMVGIFTFGKPLRVRQQLHVHSDRLHS